MQEPAARESAGEPAGSAGTEMTTEGKVANKDNVPAADNTDTATLAEKREEQGTIDVTAQEAARREMTLTAEPTPPADRASATAQSTKKRKDKSRKSKRQSKSEGQEPIPSLRKRSNKLPGAKQLEEVLLACFQPLDSEGAGTVSQELFWEVLQSPELGLQLTEEELAAVHQQLVPEPSGAINYAAWAIQAATVIASAHQDSLDPNAFWIPLTTTADRSSVVYYNKQTGDWTQPPAADIFEENASIVFHEADIGGKGYITRDEFTKVLQLSAFAPNLTKQDTDELLQQFDSIPDGIASYESFYPLAKDMILRMYRNMDTSSSEWCQIESSHGVVMLNKITGETRKAEDPTPQPPLPQGEGAYVLRSLGETFAQVESLTNENYQLKEYNKDILNQLASANEELEVMAAHLDETGRDLDMANATIKEKEQALSELHSTLAQKDQDIEQLRLMLSGGNSMQSKLDSVNRDLQQAMEAIAQRDKTIAEREKLVSDFKHQAESITDKLKTARGVIDAHESLISKLQHELRQTQERVKLFEHNFPTLEGQARSTEEDLIKTKEALEERSAALTQARKQLKAAKERNTTLEEEIQKMSSANDKLHQAESEIATLKSFLTSKTAMVEKRKKELKELRAKLSELEEKDARRAAILADVLEKTALNYQQQIMKTTRAFDPVRGDTSLPVESPRPSSAPEVARVEGTAVQSTMSAEIPFPTRRRPPVLYEGSRVRKSLTVPKLPPIRRSQKMDFSYPTIQDVKTMRKQRDSELIDHSHSNPQCSCHLCKMGSSVVDSTSKFQKPMDAQHHADVMSQVKLGTRVLAKLKRSQFDLDPQQLTGVVKYIGKIDSEFIDNQVYVGLKLDEPVGDTDGLVKGKRYFTCPPKHGKIVKMSNIIALLPNKSVFYRPVQGRSPYGTVAHKQKPSEIRVS